MIRELVLVAVDFSEVPWFARGEPPAPPVPAGFAVEKVSREASLTLFGDGPISPFHAAQRLADGDTCLVALTGGTVMAAQMWCSERARFIDWIGCDVRPPEGHVHVYNSWVKPEFRGLGLQWNLASAACRDVAARGRSKMCAGVERKEYPAFARKYAAMGLGLMVPYKSIWALQLFGVAAATIPSPPPRALGAACRNAANALARRGSQAGPAGQDETAQSEGRTRCG